MARKKSKLRQILSVRRLRWSFMRGAVRLCPPLGRAFAFPLISLRAVDCAAKVLEDRRERWQVDVTPEEVRDILRPAASNDTGDTKGNESGETLMRRQLAVLENCEVLGHTGTIFRPQEQALVNLDGSRPNWNFSKPARLKRRQLAAGRYVLLPNMGHYYHLFANDILPLLAALEGHPAELPLTALVPSGGHPAQQQVCAALLDAYPCLSVEEFGKDERLSGGTLEWIAALGTNYEWMPVTRDLAARLTRILRDGNDAPQNSTRTKRVFLDRGTAKLRRMTDEQAVRAVLDQHGYTPFIAHYGNFAEQVETFHAADRVVAVHGAGLTNLLFCRPGTQVVEIFPENFVKSTYFWLSRRLGLDYRYVIGGPGDYDQTFQAGAEALDTVLRD
ncbi:glycosyltransferase family 61 protein [Stappia taiwanensis]|uniref:Glycosyltransferase family 61 protein n=1 Tax=Stappia taiwanensis TaxID=992267 RepID=A0A838XQW0_9HYPH|nr:glycosyltransferase family 61 protein [Stappia taiwanensis]MBA4612662.1 glycosyltransferase family 61 protein [Stappia taiwanensis]GGE88652.1 hypothetical protein GCM10007285_15190 [Stappia taiwanensis]